VTAAESRLRANLLMTRDLNSALLAEKTFMNKFGGIKYAEKF
jgi:hypothetical protein